MSVSWLRCGGIVIVAQPRPGTLICMTALAVISALVTALCVGYYAGRRTGSPKSTRRKHSRHVTLARLAVSVIVLMVGRRLRKKLKAIEPLLLPWVRRSPRRPMMRLVQLTRA